MRRIAFLLGTLLVLPAFAEVVPAYYYDDATEYTDADFDAAYDDAANDTSAEAQSAAPNVVANPAQVRNARNTTGRATASRAVPSTSAATRTTSTRTTTARTTTNGGTQNRAAVTARSATTNSAAAARGTTTRGTTSRASVSRAATTAQNPGTARAATGTTQTAATNNAAPAAASTARVATGVRVTGTSTSIIQPDTVQTPLYTGRVATRGSVGARVPTIRMASASNTTETVAVSTEAVTQSMDELAQLTDFCKAQYMECMDNFCNVLDDNQGRCSCSSNIDNYAKTEAALKQATEDLQDVAQKIQYIGLSGEEVETLFTQTEAELTMQSKTDNTQLKNSLDKIKKMIVDVKGGSAASTTSGLSMDLSGLLDFSIDSTGFDLSSFLNTGNNSSSISNQRGKQLYETARNRCKTSVLNTCTQQGVDPNVITNSYDLEIDKQCILYERALSESNDQMAATVRNAKSVLQKARLMVAQQKNEYDLRGCISALDSCMQDDYVCGSDYENCLDPTGRYIVNGEIVIGSMPGYSIESDKGIDAGMNLPGSNLYSVWEYSGNKNAWANKADEGTLGDYISTSMKGVDNKGGFSSTKTDNMVQYLVQKIGYHNDSDNRDYGMCMSVLNRCQNYTYKDTGSKAQYMFNNTVITEYLTRALVQIKAAQDTMLADYAEDCITDVQACITTNSSYYSNSNTDTNLNIAINACKAQITTCMSVNGDLTKTPTPGEMETWVRGVIYGSNREMPVTVATTDELKAYCNTFYTEGGCKAANVTCYDADNTKKAKSINEACDWKENKCEAKSTSTCTYN